MRLTSVAKGLPAENRCLVLDASAVTHIDSTGAAALDAVAEILAKRNIVFAMTDLSEESRGILERAGVVEAIGVHNLFNGREEALRALIGSVGETGSTASAG